ncbi:TM2 domain-containing protein [Paenibacillus hexagrammi]|uniref:TM2 domain-containing protein n=1 Tax=Paenibacillus hexagrammi TaxID=2908839 RepID=A0ABY3SHE2_9BACL|nr:TM2 domain-containing protein [Paenibacillus sp. YPD9-1]UJF33458.1 TM2 domain-containing protein [Paenibacillus sp. YPD9-1]
MLKFRKSKEAAWGLWAGLSFFGAHRFYTENYGYASIMLSTSAVPFVVILFIAASDMDGLNMVLLWLSIILLAGSVIWSWIDAFFLNKRIEELNHAQEREIIARIKGYIPK